MTKHKKAARSASKKGRSRLPVVVKKKPVKSGKPANSGKSAKSEKNIAMPRNFEAKATALVQKGRDRGFVTYDEILKEFPQIENDIFFLDGLYAKFTAANVDVLEGGGLLEIEELKEKDKKAKLVMRMLAK